MADHLHMLLSLFRKDVLTSLSNLEFQIRDLNNYHDMPPLIPISAPPPTPSLESTNEAKDLKNEIINLKECVNILNTQISLLMEEKEQRNTFLNIQSNENTRNILVRTPALEAAVAAANDMEPFTLDKVESDSQSIDNEGQLETQVEEEEEEVEEEGEEVEEEGEEVEEEEEEVEVEEEEVEVEEEEEEVDQSETENEVGTVDEDAVEVEEFEYKGTTYQRDEDGVVYLEGDEVGQWNGKRIIFKTT